ncbi:MAG: IS1595 family transposase, partial [Alphaproteobacteria bacterium]|nr:IS1595 family transposase [Alphaproteobacteria bacterium]
MAKRIHQMTVRQWEASFPNDDACKTYLVANRWPSGVACPRCGNPDVGEHGTRAFHWQCYQCSAKGTSYRFSVTVGTIFENTKYPLREWFRVIHLMLTSKKGISALQIHRMIGTGSYETAWSMCHRIRAAMIDKDFRKLMGIVEVDETYIGGDDDNRHFGKKHGKYWREKKIPVVGAVSRKGKVVARVINNCGTETLEHFIRNTVDTNVSLLATDDHHGYRDLPRSGYRHGAANHSKKKYVVGAVHTNTIEG